MRTFLAIAVLLVLAVPAHASHCTTYSTTRPEVTLDVYYVDISECHACIFPSIWIYEESNGIDGLQRGDQMQDDTCHGMIASDTLTPF